MKLIIEDDEGRKTVVPIVREEVEITIGRLEGNTIRLTERNVSRHHARLVRHLGQVLIEDLNSFNGIKVNGDRITGTQEIQEGDLVQIGDYDLAIQEDKPTAQAAAVSEGSADTALSSVPEMAEALEATTPAAPRPATRRPTPPASEALAPDDDADDRTPLPSAEPANRRPPTALASEVAPRRPTPPAREALPAEGDAEDVTPLPSHEPARRSSTALAAAVAPRRPTPPARAAQDPDVDAEEATPLPSAEPAIRRSSTALATPRGVEDIPVEEAPRLVLTTGEFAGREYACILSELTIGRAAENDIAIDDRSLSRSHCRLVRDGGTWRAIDLQSATGLKINGKSCAKGELTFGDSLELGRLAFAFVAPGDEVATADAAEPRFETDTRPLAPRRSRRLPLLLLAGGAAALVALAVGGTLAMRALRAKSAAAGGLVDLPDNPKRRPPELVEPPAPPPPAPSPEPSSPREGPAPAPEPSSPREGPAPAPPATRTAGMAPDPRALKAFEVGKALFAEGRYVEAERKLVFAKDAGVEGAPELLAKTRAFLAKPVDPKARPPHRAEPLRHTPPLDPKEEAQHAYSEGKGFLKAENWARAVVSYQRAVAADPDLREAQFDLAVCLRKAGALGAALVEFQRFEAKWPTDGRRGIAEYNIKEINLQLTQSAP